MPACEGVKYEMLQFSSSLAGNLLPHLHQTIDSINDVSYDYLTLISKV